MYTKSTVKIVLRNIYKGRPPFFVRLFKKNVTTLYYGYKTKPLLREVCLAKW